MPLWIAPATALLLAYLLGSIPFGVILTKLGGAGDLRQIGSGNIGATNVLRTGRKGLAAATLVLDGAKGAVAILIAGAIWQDYLALAAAGAFFGHLFPVWLRFNGGKGVATLLGIALALAWPVGLAFALVWLVALYLSKRSSVGGMAAALSTPVSAVLLHHTNYMPLFLGLALICVWKHQDNIRRLIAGTEPKVGQKGK
jgi:glycerol-3-phosphate acyltransferase PlsY